MPVAVNDIWTFSLHAKLFGQEVVNTFALRVKEIGGTIQEAGWMALYFQDTTGFFNTDFRLRDAIRLAQSSEVSHEFWQVKRITPNETASYIWPIITNKTGAIEITCETPNLAMSIERKGAGPSRRQRGRIAVAGIPTSRMAAGEFTGPALVDAALIAEQLCINTPADAARGVVTMGFYSPPHTGTVDGVPVNYPGQFVECYTAQARSTVRVQRSRTVGKGS